MPVSLTYLQVCAKRSQLAAAQSAAQSAKAKSAALKAWQTRRASPNYVPPAPKPVALSPSAAAKQAWQTRKLRAIAQPLSAADQAIVAADFA